MEDQILDEGFRVKTLKDDLVIANLKVKNKKHKTFIYIGQFSLFATVFFYIIIFSMHFTLFGFEDLGEGNLGTSAFLLLIFLMIYVSTYFKPKLGFALGLTAHLFILIFQLKILEQPFSFLYFKKTIIIFLLFLALRASFRIAKNNKKIIELGGKLDEILR